MLELSIILVGLLLKLIRLFTLPVLKLIYRKQCKRIPPIKDDLLKIPAVDLAAKIRMKEVTSEHVVTLYIERVRAVNPIINAVVDERFSDAIEEAKKADKMVEETSPLYLLDNYPFLGVPFSVKESVGLKGLQYAVGSLARSKEKSQKDGEAVRLLRGAGAIPICITNVPEWCMSWESYNFVNGRTLNPYDLSRTCGGSSGGEGALIGAGASLFATGSDIAGSIRVPSLFNGIWGHKPTAEVVSLEGHFPYSPDQNFRKFLTVGPMTRYSKDLMPLLHIMSDRNPKLRLNEPFLTKDIKIYYKFEINGLGFEGVGVDECLTECMFKALQHFKGNGLAVTEADIDTTDCYNIGVTMFLSMKEIPDLFGYKKGKSRDNCVLEFGKILCGKSEYTLAGWMLATLRETKPLISEEKMSKYFNEYLGLRQKFLNMLGEDGVFFFPTYCKPAGRHYESPTLLSGVFYTMLFNIMGFPATHVPMGLNKDNLPIGFQVVSAPYQDRLCLSIACEIEHAFGGWIPPS